MCIIIYLFFVVICLYVCIFIYVYIISKFSFLWLYVYSSLLLLDKTFTQHGGDSLTALQFTAVVKELFGVNLNVDTLLSSNISLDQLTSMISSYCGVPTDDTVDLMKSDMDLELPKFNGSNVPSVKATKSVFLTGG